MVAFGVVTAAGQTRTVGPYTAGQADAGRAVYLSHCASCHLPDLGGRNEAAELAGSNFIRAWGARTTSDLFTFIRSTMPPGDRGNLGDENYVNLVAFLLSANGARAGNQPLTARQSRGDWLGCHRADACGSSKDSREHHGGCAGGPAGLPAHGTAGDRPSQELRAGHRRDAAQSRSRRLADDPAQLSGSELQSAGLDHHREREGSAPGVGVGHERRRRQRADAHRAQRHHLSCEHQQHGAGSRWPDRRSDLGELTSAPSATRAYGATRSLGIYQDKVFIATTDAQLYALDARTGKIVWQTGIADPKKGYSNTSGPLVIHGKVVQGLMGCAQFRPEGCFISAYDAASGKQLWKFQTVAREGQPGGDTWGSLPSLMRAGGETWITGSYDPDLNETYWGVAQAKPWMRASRGAKPGDKALFTSSTVALNPDDGKLAWYFQHVPGESLDLDEVFERVLVDSGGQKLMFTIGKAGILWKLDRETRQVPRRSRRRSFRTSSPGSIRRRASRLIAATFSSRRSASGFRPVRAPKADTTGRR